MNYVCFICKDNISGYKKFENHILNDHNLTLTKYYDIEHNTNSVCMKCGNESMFDKSLKSQSNIAENVCHYLLVI